MEWDHKMRFVNIMLAVYHAGSLVYQTMSYNLGEYTYHGKVKQNEKEFYSVRCHYAGVRPNSGFTDCKNEYKKCDHAETSNATFSLK
jgi:hypothetical protein